MGTELTRYVVVHSDGRTKAMLYRTVGSAKRGCLRDGDSVVVVDVDLTREPIFIRSKRL